MSPDILIPCHRCGRQVPSSQVREGRCVDCRVDAGLADLRDEHRRLWRKRERYRTQGANADSVGRQLGRVEERMAERIMALVSDKKVAVEQLEKTLEQARQSRYDIRSQR